MRASCASARRARALLGTLVEIRVPASAQAERAVQRAFAAIERVHRAMSAQESTSDIARLRSGRRSALDPWTRRVLDRAEEIRLATAGLFDCAACGHALDGIAKGFAVDRAVDALQSAGVRTGVVNAGGDLRVFGEAFEEVYVRPPQLPDRLLHIGRLRDAAVATSATTLLVDPRSAPRALRAAGATVIAADCMTADALTKPCLLEPEQAHPLAARFCAHAIVLGMHG
ncbi:MAG TPA: FAD:protein FMN transferase [Burkholderiales bacterium]|nr:FAD:protein FMN transferase [Burkholderiales bacterium]